jgi:ubiquinone/menaquinone biosynthesis C-methylase UbiE
MVRRGNRRYHDRVAGRYDQVYDTPYWRFYRDLSWRHARRYLPTARPARAADLGCGTGWFGRKLLEAGLHCLFLDPSGKMIGKAQEGADELAAARNLEATYLQTDLEHLDAIEDGSIDYATAQGDPLSFCEDPRDALRQLHRVLAPGAHLVLSVDSRVAGVRTLAEAPTPEPMLELLRTGRTTWTGDRAEERFGMKMFDPSELDALLERTGFHPVSRIAKTCLVQRHNQAWLEDPTARKKLLQAEERIHADPAWFALAGHFQVAAQRAAT